MKKKTKLNKTQRKRLASITGGVAFFIVGIVLHLFDLTLLSAICFVAAGVAAGLMCVSRAIKGISRGSFFDENTLMTIAAIGAVAIGEYPECAAVMILYQVGELFQSLAVGKSRRAIAALSRLCPDTANVLRDGVFTEVDATEVVCGDTIRISAGDRIPVDCTVTKGSTTVDTSPVTGESVPLEAFEGATLYSGCMNLTGLIEAQVIRPASESAAARILNLTEQASDRKTASEAFITRFAKIYTPLVCIIATITAFVIPLFISLILKTPFLTEFAVWGKKSLSMLVISCPCALVISVPLGYFCGLGKASSSGILIKGSAFIDTLAKAEYALFDKTGTLTKGSFVIDKVSTDDVSETDLLKYSASAEFASSHPIAKAICDKYDGALIEALEVEEIAGKGIRAKLSDGSTVCVFRPEVDLGITAVEVILNGKLIGTISFTDELKADSKEAVTKLKHLGIKETVMLTGDDSREAERIKSATGIDTVHSRLHPEDKLYYIESYCNKGTVIYAGDGINDAPALARSDAGVAMGALGTEAAIEAADIVLMDSSPIRLAEAVALSKKTHRTVKANIIISLAVKLLVLALSMIGICGMWSAVLADVGVCIVCVSNSTRLLK